MNVKVFSRLVAVLCSTGALASVDCGTAESAQDAVGVPEDECVLELILPEGATVTVDGNEYGTKRKLIFESLQSGTRYTSTVQVRFSDGSRVERNVLIEGGRLLRLALVAPSVGRPELVVQTGKGWALHHALSPNGRYFAHGNRDGVASLWDASSGRRLRTFVMPHFGSSGLVAFSPDGRLLATCDSEDGQSVIILWDVTSGAMAKTISVSRSLGLGEHVFSPGELVFSPNGRYLASTLDGESERGSRFGRTMVWNVKTGKLAYRIDHPSGGACKSLAFRPDGMQFAVLRGGHVDGQLENGWAEVYDAISGRKIRSLETGLSFRALRYSGDGRLLATAADKYGTVYEDWDEDKELGEVKFVAAKIAIWDATSVTKLWEKSREKKIDSLAFSRDAQWVTATGYERGYRDGRSFSQSDVVLWDARRGSIVWELLRDSRIDSIAFTPDSNRIIVGMRSDRAAPDIGSESEVFLVDVCSGAKLLDFEWRDPFTPKVVGFRNDGQHVFLNGTVFDVKTGKRICEMSGPSQSIRSIQFTPDGTHVLIDNTLWDLGAGRARLTFEGNGARLSPDGSYAISWIGERGDRNPALWNTRTGRRTRMLGTQVDYSEALAFSPDSLRLAVSATDGRCDVWDLTSGRRVGGFETEQYQEPELIVFSPDGKMVLTAQKSVFMPIGPYHDLTFRDAQTFQKLRKVDIVDRFWDIVFTPDSRYVIAATYDGYPELSDADDNSSLVFISLRTGESVRTLKGPVGALQSVSLSADGSIAAATYHGGVAVVWDIASGQTLRTIKAHDTWFVDDCAISPDGRMLMTGGSDGMAKMWDIATGSEVLRLVNVGRGDWLNVDERGGWLVATPEGLFDGSEQGRKAVTYRVGNGLNVVPADRFYQDFYYPGLLATVWRGERQLPATDFASKLAPAIQIVSPEQSGTVDSAQLELQVEVTDRGGGVKGPWLLQNGARVLSPGRPVAKGKIIERSFEVALVEGENRLEVCAASEDGSWESEPAVITFTYQESLPEPQLHLLVVGVNRYAQGTMNLKFAVSDAKAMAGLFQERGPALYGANRVHVKELLDAEATADGIEKAIAEIADKARSQDTLVVFLAGHGTTVGQRYYFIPHDFESEADELEDDIRTQGLPGDVLGDWIGAVPALKRVVIFDTCQSGGTIRISRTARSPFAFRGALERLSRSQGIFTLAATSATDEAQEVPDLGHGVLTYALLAAMGAVDQGPLRTQPLKRSEEHVVQVRDWFSFAQDKVPRLTSLYFGEEQFVGFSGSGSDFPILPYE